MSSLGRLSIFLMATLVGSANIYAQNNTRMNLRNRLPGAGGAQVSRKTLRLNIRIFSVSNNRSRRTAASRRVLETNPDFARAYFNLGFCLQEQGRLDEAFESYRRAVAMEPGLFKEILTKLTLSPSGRLWLNSKEIRRALNL